MISYNDFINESIRKMYKFTGVRSDTKNYTAGIYYLMMVALDKTVSDEDFLEEVDDYFGSAFAMMLRGKKRDEFAVDFRKIFSDGDYDWEFNSYEIDDGDLKKRDDNSLKKLYVNGWETYFSQEEEYGNENWMYIMLNKKFTEAEKIERSKYIKLYIEKTSLDEKQISSFYNLMTPTDRESIKHIYLATKYGI